MKEISRCQDCDSKLWSEHAKHIGLCPECELVDFDYNAELEEQLEQANAE